MRCVSACADAVFERMFFVYILDAPPDPLDIHRNTMDRHKYRGEWFEDSCTWYEHQPGACGQNPLLSFGEHGFLIGAVTLL
jgi:hypothetical protein